MKQHLSLGFVTLFLGMSSFGLAFSFFSSVPVDASAEKGLSHEAMDLCALQKDFAFFSKTESRQAGLSADALSCEEMMLVRETLFPSKESRDQTAAPLSELVGQISGMVAGFPIEVMTKAIGEYDREIAGLIVGIGKKESNWGKRTPKLLGEECFNYWGYRGAGDRGLTPDGYGCFETPEAAVRAIGNRLIELRELRSSGTPERMVVWKCGNSCATHSPESVRKWISDVDLYYREIALK
ncbi:MAG: hypothetical protein WAU88_07645 [Candidatus Zixiibacteriota bacterium]